MNLSFHIKVNAFGFFFVLGILLRRSTNIVSVSFLARSRFWLLLFFFSAFFFAFCDDLRSFNSVFALNRSCLLVCLIFCHFCFTFYLFVWLGSACVLVCVCGPRNGVHLSLPLSIFLSLSLCHSFSPSSTYFDSPPVFCCCCRVSFSLYQNNCAVDAGISVSLHTAEVAKDAAKIEKK